MSAACPGCGCVDADHCAHAVMAALVLGDIDCALDAGLLVCAACSGCSDDCRRRFSQARDERERALAARDRFRAREARLARRRLERERQRAAAHAASPAALPAAAAAALARARERAMRKP